jgi:3-hydroxyisobutyrate dehydrogenase
MVERDFACRGALDIDVKDLNYILDMGRSLKAPLLLSAVAKEIFQMGSVLGFGKEDDSAVVKVLEKMAGLGATKIRSQL